MNFICFLASSTLMIINLLIAEEIMAKKMAKILMNDLLKREKDVQILMKIAHFVLKNKLAFTKFVEMSSFMFENIINDISSPITQHQSSTAFLDFMYSLNYVISNKIITAIKQSLYLYYAILLDETTDNSNQSQLIIYIKYFDVTAAEVAISFLGLKKLVQTTGLGIFIAVDDHLTKLAIPWSKCIALGSDNASNMKGIYKGVLSLLLFTAHVQVTIYLWLIMTSLIRLNTYTTTLI